MVNESVIVSAGAEQPDQPIRGWRLLLQPAGLIGGAGIALVVLLAVLGRLSGPEAGLGVLIVGGATAFALWPRPKVVEAPIAAVEVERPFDTAVELFANTLLEPCLIVNTRAVVLSFNSAAHDVFPRLRNGDPLAFTLRHPELVDAIDKVIENAAPQTVELHLTAPNDTWYRCAIAPYRPKGDEGPGFLVITLLDLTEQKRTDRMRGDFIANASHELRTPLTSLMGFIDTLQGPAAKDEAARTRFLGIMRGQSERMSGLIDDLLSLSRIELRQHVKPTTEVNLNLLLREVAETLEPRLAETGIAIALDVPAETITVMGDRQELFEVIENLADNAIKYGGDGKRVEMTLLAGVGRNNGFNAVRVTDFGAGVAEEHVPRLTERFYRVDADSSRRKKGTGLGLAIVKHIVSRHHGEMTIRSTPGQGTQVEILLPRRD